jgi:DNA-binding HxlR family transcriptional regulator
MESRTAQEITGPGFPATPDYGELSIATRLLGDRWSLPVVRELAMGNNRFGEIHDALPGLSRSLLCSRLRYLERLGILERRQSNVKDRRSTHIYVLTEVGWGLAPVLRALGDWALRWQFPDGADEPNNVLLLLRRFRDSVEPSSLPSGRISIQFYLSDSTAKSFYLRVGRGGVRACLGTDEGSSDLVVRSTPATLSELYAGRRTCRDAIAHRDITFEGPVAYAQSFPEWFPNRPAIRGSGWRSDEPEV